MLQFITDGNTPQEIIEQTFQAIDGGCRWIQIRMKDADDDAVTTVVKAVITRCHDTSTTLLLDDRVELALKLGVDGVHLGKEDMPADEARKILGPKAIIGSTANSIEDILNLASAPINYLGVGPFRFTTTKKRLAPVLGLEGYAAIIKAMKENGITFPVVAIGGITIEDIEELMATGIYGIAISGAIAHANSPETETRKFISKLNIYQNHE
jgi:thiamine-phosphate pyrophosphorylase